MGFGLLQRANNGGPQSVDVYVDGTKVNASPFSAGSSWTAFSANFTTTAGVHSIQFRGTNAGDNTAFVDSVSFG